MKVTTKQINVANPKTTPMVLKDLEAVGAIQKVGVAPKPEGQRGRNSAVYEVSDEVFAFLPNLKRPAVEATIVAVEAEATEAETETTGAETENA